MASTAIGVELEALKLHAARLTDLLVTARPREGEVIVLRAFADVAAGLFADAFATFVSDGGHLIDGQATAGQWLADRTHSWRSEATTALASVRLLDNLPQIAAALAAGRIGQAHVRILARAVTTARQPYAVRDEEVLVESAVTLSPAEFNTVVRQWAALCDDDLGDPTDADTAQARRNVRLSALPDGRWRLTGDLDPLAGEALATALDQTMGPPAAEEERTVVQRRHDALADIAFALLGRDGGLGTKHGEPVTVTVIAHPSGIGTTSSGMVLPRYRVDALRCDARIVQATLNCHGKPIHVSVPTSDIPAAARRQVIIRDRCCRMTGCGRPAYWCDVHHMNGRECADAHHPDRLVLLCKYHHTYCHRHHITIELDQDGVTMIFTWPDGRRRRSTVNNYVA